MKCTQRNCGLDGSDFFSQLRALSSVYSPMFVSAAAPPSPKASVKPRNFCGAKPPQLVIAPVR
jgi:hypothetical protein